MAAFSLSVGNTEELAESTLHSVGAMQAFFAVQVAPSVKLVTGGLAAGKPPGSGAGASQAPSHVFGVPVHEQGKAASSNAVPRTQQASVQQDKVRLPNFI